MLPTSASNADACGERLREVVARLAASCPPPHPSSAVHSPRGGPACGAAAAPCFLMALPTDLLCSGLAPMLGPAEIAGLVATCKRAGADLQAGGAWRLLARRDFAAVWPLLKRQPAPETWRELYAGLWRGLAVFNESPEAWEHYMAHFLEAPAAEPAGPALVRMLAAQPDAVSARSLVTFACHPRVRHHPAVWDASRAPGGLARELFRGLPLAGVHVHHALLGAAQTFGVPSSSRAVEAMCTALARAYAEQNPRTSPPADNVFVVCMAAIILNTDFLRAAGAESNGAILAGGGGGGRRRRARAARARGASMPEQRWVENVAPLLQPAEVKDAAAEAAAAAAATQAASATSQAHARFLFAHMREYPLLFRPRREMRGWVQLSAGPDRGLLAPLMFGSRVYAECAGGVLQWWHTQPRSAAGRRAADGAVVLQSRDRSPPPGYGSWVLGAGHSVDLGLATLPRRPVLRLEHVSAGGECRERVLTLCAGSHPETARWVASVLCGIQHARIRDFTESYR